MRSPTIAAISSLLPLAYSQSSSVDETVLGVYMFHRHGDRTAKMTPPANLTALGYQEVYTSGQYYRDRYVSSSAAYKINGLNSDLVKQSQITVSAPLDDVLQNSAMGFLQALYPPVGSGLDQQTLRNGTVVTMPMDGYQLIPVELVTRGGGSENNGWLQSAQGCARATISSNNYFNSEQYQKLLSSTQGFYQHLDPVVNGVFDSAETNFKNAYTIFDLINVAEIHNTTFDPTGLVTPEIFFQLRTLADSQQWGLAYNASDNMRAIAGMTLAAQVTTFFNDIITSQGASKLGIQFGAYGTFSSFFGLAIPEVASKYPELMGLADYASAMAFEMFTNSSNTANSATSPSTQDIYVRMLFHNGTTSNSSEPQVYQLFGSGQDALSWADFQKGMGGFSIGSTQQWCHVCGNSTGQCAAYAGSTTGAAPSATSSASGSGSTLSPVENGAIGAMVALVVVLGVEALILLVTGLRVVKKSKAARRSEGEVERVESVAVKA